MLISGFTIIKNAIKYDFPVVESIKSILPICDEYIVVLGDSDDGTENLIKGINDTKIKIILNSWVLNNKNTKMGEIIKEKTDFALSKCNSRWAFYLQADEIVHENDLDKIKYLLEKHKEDNSVEAFVFDYYHFYGTYDNYIVDPKIIYPWAIRIIRNKGIFEAKGDACTFMKKKNIFGFRPRVKEVRAGCYIYHYGMVRPPEMQKERLMNMYSLYKDLKWAQGNYEYFSAGNRFVYEDIEQPRFSKFTGVHPVVMKNRINKYNENII